MYVIGSIGLNRWDLLVWIVDTHTCFKYIYIDNIIDNIIIY